VQRRGGRGPLAWQPIAQNLNVSFKFSKIVNIFMLIIANLVGNRNNAETYRDNRDRVEGPATTMVGGGEKGYAISRPGHI
jgi:hypothetical protein